MNPHSNHSLRPGGDPSGTNSPPINIVEHTFDYKGFF